MALFSVKRDGGHMRALILFLVTVVLGGCSSITSKKGIKNDEGDGLIYYMPKKDFLVTVTRAGGKLTAITLGTTTAYADLSKTYSLHYHRNLLAKNKLEVEVSPSGLLTTSKSNTTGDIAEAFKSLGTSAGSIRALGISSGSTQRRILPKSVPCDVDGAHTFVFDGAVESESICGGSITVAIQRLWNKDEEGKIATSKKDGSEDSGIFYRMNRPYLFVASGGGLNAASVVNSPSESDVLFLPISRTLFAANDAQITLHEGGGVPSKYVQETDGELVALFKIPANILTGYFDAIAATFGKSSANDKAQAAALNDALKVEIVKQKYEACLAAIRAKDDKLIADLKCGQAQ
jgi:hypothetical protein